jgi:hypothetical protein
VVHRILAQQPVIEPLGTLRKFGTAEVDHQCWGNPEHLKMVVAPFDAPGCLGRVGSRPSDPDRRRARSPRDDRYLSERTPRQMILCGIPAEVARESTMISLSISI